MTTIDDTSPLPEHPPGRGALGPAVERFDQAADELLERVRGNPVADKVFTTASHVAEFSLVWHAISLTRGAIRREPRRVVALAIGIGLESLIVNQGLKRLFKRTRPTTSGDERLQVRAPVTSSFPSGHASAAAFASTVMSDRDGPLLSTAWYGAGSIVALSRAYVRIHHASDVVGGLVVGRVLGLVGRRVLRRFT
jgi:membrane-associated phospholipid phosphatase